MNCNVCKDQRDTERALWNFEAYVLAAHSFFMQRFAGDLNALLTDRDYLQLPSNMSDSRMEATIDKLLDAESDFESAIEAARELLVEFRSLVLLLAFGGDSKMKRYLLEDLTQMESAVNDAHTSFIQIERGINLLAQSDEEQEAAKYCKLAMVNARKALDEINVAVRDI